MLNWLENYRRERQEKTTPGKTDVGGSVDPEVLKRPNRTKRGLVSELEQENSMPNFQAIASTVPTDLSAPVMSSEQCCTPVKQARSLLEERLAMVPGSVGNGDSPVHTPSPPARKTLSDITSSNVLMPKKRWLREVFSEQQSTGSASNEVLARPIRWNEDEDERMQQQQQQQQRRSPKSLIVATALVELATDKPGTPSSSPTQSQATPIIHDQNQPLNLSVNSR